MIRKTLLTTLAVLLLFGVILYNGWNLFKIHEGVKTLLAAKIRSTFGEQSSIDELTFGLGSLNLNGVNLVSEDSPYQLWIERVSIGYSLKSILSGGVSPQKKADEITIHKPRLTLRYTSSENEKSQVDLSLQLSEQQEKLYHKILQEYDFIERVTISDGEIVAIDTRDGKETTLAKAVSGWVYTGRGTKAWMRLAGHLFDADAPNMILYGQLDLRRGGIDYVNIDLHDYAVGAELAYLLPGYMEVMQGTVNGSLVVTERPAPELGFDISGTVALTDGAIRLASENISIEHISLAADVKDWNMEIAHATQNVNGSPTEITGRILNLLNPRLDLRMTSRRFDVEKFLSEFLPEKKYPFAGLASFDLSITQTLKHPMISGVVRSDSLRFYRKTIRNISLDADFEDLRLHFNNIAGDFGGARLAGQGSVEFLSRDKMIDFAVDVHGDFTHDLSQMPLASRLNRCQGNAEIKVFGSMLDPVSTGDFDLVFSHEIQEVQALSGSYRYSQGRFVLNANSLDNEFRLNASVDSIFAIPVITLQSTNIERAFAFLNDPALNYVKDHYHVNVSVDGPYLSPKVTLDAYRADNYDKIFHLDGMARKDAHNEFFEGVMALFPGTAHSMNGDVSLTKGTDGKWRTLLNLDDWLEGTLEHSSASSLLNGELFISGMDVSSMLALLGKDADAYRGDIYGRVKLNGTPNAPQYSGELWLMNGFIDKQGPFKAELAFHSDLDSLHIKRLTIENNENTRIAVKGRYDYRSQYITGSLAGTYVRIEDIIKLLTKQGDIASGEAFLQVQLNGRLPDIPVFGTITVQNLRILMLEFDTVLFDLGSRSHPNGSTISVQALDFQSATLTKNGEFELRGKAKLPLRQSAPLDVHLTGAGNFLSLLPDMTDFFEETDSQGFLDLSLAGHYKTPDFSGSQLMFSDGYLRLSDIADRIEDIEGDLVIRDEDYFLDIKQLQGTIKGKTFAIRNTHQLAGLNHGIYEPLRVAGNNLNLGALILETTADGIPLHIPGLMAKGDVGRYALGGKDTGEHFFVTGPWERPKVRGRVLLRNASVMFPFDENAGDGNPIVMNIINNINWDVDLYSAKNTRFVRQFPGGIYVNMEVDKKNSHLSFNGILKDSTFTINGKVESTRGNIEYLDLSFRVEKVGAEFNQTLYYPNVYGKAWTVLRDSTNIPNDVYMELYTVDHVTNQEISKGRWDRINIKLSSEYPGYQETQQELLATLGYSAETMDEQAMKVVGSSTDNLIFRPLLRPVERQLERNLGLDVVRFSYSIAQNFLNSSFNNDELSSSLALLRSSRLMLGKYITDDVYLLYTGELKAGIDYQFQDKGVGLRHIVGLEYRLNSKWLLQMEYDYNTLFESHKDDKKVSLRHSFPF